MKKLLGIATAAVLSSVLLSGATAGAAEPDKCIKVGDYFPAPVDFGREPKITLTGISAQAFVAKIGADPEDVEATDTVVIYFVALPMEAAHLASADLRFVAVYQHGCLADGGMIPFGKIEHLIPGV